MALQKTIEYKVSEITYHAVKNAVVEKGESLNLHAHFVSFKDKASRDASFDNYFTGFEKIFPITKLESEGNIFALSYAKMKEEWTDAIDV